MTFQKYTRQVELLISQCGKRISKCGKGDTDNMSYCSTKSQSGFVCCSFATYKSKLNDKCAAFKDTFACLCGTATFLEVESKHWIFMQLKKSFAKSLLIALFQGPFTMHEQTF